MTSYWEAQPPPGVSSECGMMGPQEQEKEGSALPIPPPDVPFLITELFSPADLGSIHGIYVLLAT